MQTVKDVFIAIIYFSVTVTALATTAALNVQTRFLDWLETV